MFIMYKNKKILYTIAVAMFAILLLAFFIPFGSSRIACAILLLPMTVAVCKLVRKKGAYSLAKKEVTLILAAMAGLTVMLFYLTGISFGFVNSQFPLSFKNFALHLLPLSVIIITTEIIRAVILSHKLKIADSFCYLACVVAEVLCVSGFVDIQNFNDFMDVLGLALLPALSEHMLYNYVCRKYGPVPNIIHRLILTLYPYVISIVPATPDALVSFAKLILPFFAYIFVDMLYEKKKIAATPKTGKWTYVGISVSVVFMISIVMLVSNHFRFGVLVIGSGSMTGELDRGDAVIFEKYTDQNIAVGNIIVFEDGDSLIIHRVVDIQNIDGTNRYYTKGDANEEADVMYHTDSQILGLTRWKIPYAGYPSLWMRDIFT